MRSIAQLVVCITQMSEDMRGIVCLDLKAYFRSSLAHIRAKRISDYLRNYPMSGINSLDRRFIFR